MMNLNWAMTILSTWIADAAYIGTTTLAAVALWIAVGQLRKAAESARIAATAAEKAEIVSEAQAVLALDQVLAQQRFETLREKLNRTYAPGTATEKLTVRRYVAAFERLGLLLDKGVISAELAEAFYSSRLERLVKNCAFVREIVVDKDDKTKGSVAWRNFVLLWTEMEQRWESNDSRKPPRMPD